MGGRLAILKTDVLALFLLLTAATGASWSGVWAARTAFLDLGPNDGEYIHGFRQGWERDGRTRFHWTTFSSLIRIPVHAAGNGFVLRARLRRHMTEAARVALRVEGRVVHTFDVVGGSDYEYKTIDIGLPRLDGTHPFILGIEATSADPRPLGVALDWVELERQGEGRFSPLRPLPFCMAALVACAYLSSRLAGLAWPLAFAPAAVLLALSGVGLSLDLVALERILRLGMPVYAVAAVACVLLLKRGPARVLPGRVSGTLVVIALAALAVRLTLLLHPRFYYPDVKIHAVVAYELSKQGLAGFLSQLPAIQYRFSLGLQFENGHWYAFPYPPGFYLLCWPLLRFLPLTPEVVVSVVAAFVNSLEVILTFVLARWLLRSDRSALIAATAHAALPLFLVRSVLAYFPALVGHAVDACALVLLFHTLRTRRPRAMILFGALVTLSLLAYTQALVNFGIVVPLFLLLDLVSDRSREGRQRQIGLAAAAILGVVLSVVLFYGRYSRFLIDMSRGVPMPEEQLLLEKQELERRHAAAVPSTEIAVEEVDPYAGPNLNLLRGLRKAGWRLLVFYGPFALSVAWGLVLVVRAEEGPARRLLIAWAATYLILNVASGGLPSPNLLRYNKDLEVVAPLFCVALAATTTALARRWRWAGATHLVGFVLFGLWRGLETWRATMFFER